MLCRAAIGLGKPHRLKRSHIRPCAGRDTTALGERSVCHEVEEGMQVERYEEAARKMLQSGCKTKCGAGQRGENSVCESG